ncbi:trypsin CFT-1-like [Battus philenor]|uniref:trypsin CFT-1-like n=1 Tax=Battus philenor TaxID=42288 RepID=UPI0035CEB3D9
MRVVYVIVTAIVASTLAAEREDLTGVIGGSLTTIKNHPYLAALLFSSDLAFYWQRCVGAIITSRTALSIGHCFVGDTDYLWRIRVGSSYANSGGNVHVTARIIIHPEINPFQFENDVAVLHSATPFIFSDSIRAGAIAGVNYVLGNNQPLLAIGWGRNSVNATASEELRQIQVNYIDMNKCRNIYVTWAMYPSDDMLCSGWDQANDRQECQGEQGGPVLHNDVIVGLTSWGLQCLYSQYPGISTRVSSFTPWIVANA